MSHEIPSPTDALRFARAQLRDDEKEIIEKTIGFIGAAIRDQMKYDGVTIDIPGIPRHLLIAVMHRMESIEPGWILTATYWEKPGKFAHNIMQTGFLLQVTPNDDAYRAAGLKPPAVHAPLTAV